MRRLLKTQAPPVHKQLKPPEPGSPQGSPVNHHHDNVRRVYDGDGGDLSCGHHKTGTVALHWIASIFLSASPHLDLDTNRFEHDFTQYKV